MEPVVRFSSFFILSSNSTYLALTCSMYSSNYFRCYKSLSLFWRIAKSSAFFSSSYLLISSVRYYLSCWAKFLLIVFGVKGRSYAGVTILGAPGVGMKDGGSSLAAPSYSGSSSSGQTRCKSMMILESVGIRRPTSDAV